MKDKKSGLFGEVGRDVREVASSARVDDGVDPREEALRRRRERRVLRPGQGHGIHKQEQFHSQVQQAIESALQTSSSPLLNGLFVEEVVQQGGSLVVVVKLPESAGSEAAALAEAARELEQAASRLRREVAETITRKEAPTLSFVVLPPGAQKIGE